MDGHLTRRGAFAASGLSAIAVAGFASLARAADSNATQSVAEKANLKVVQDFITTWGAKDFDADKVAREFLANASVRIMETLPFASDPAAIAAVFKQYMSHGERVTVQYLGTYTKGPIVVTHRIDTETIPSKPNEKFEVVGVFFLKDGKIKEWTDYIVSGAPAP